MEKFTEPEPSENALMFNSSNSFPILDFEMGSSYSLTMSLNKLKKAVGQVECLSPIHIDSVSGANTSGN